MNKNIFIGIAVLIAGGIVGWYALNGEPTTKEPKTEITTKTVETATATPVPTDTASSSAMVTEKMTVMFTEKGFDPKNITVKKGTTVTFVNNADMQMWVASALHPTHQELPGFDQLSGIAKGGTYEYTFIKVGTWKYHDHLSPQYFGSVVVTE